jgi:hypothetical protein
MIIQKIAAVKSFVTLGPGGPVDLLTKEGEGWVSPGNTKGITVPLTSCLTGLESAVKQLTIFVLICKTDKSKPIKQEVNCTVKLPPLVFPGKSVCLNLTSK